MEKLSSWRVDDLEILAGETKEFLFQTSNPNMFFIQNPNNVVLKVSLSKMPTSENYEFSIEKNSSLTFGRPIPSKKITILNDSAIAVSIKMFSVNAPFDMSVNKNLSLNLVGAEIHTDGEVKGFSNGVQLPPGNNKIGRVGLADEEKNLLNSIEEYTSSLTTIEEYTSSLSTIADDRQNIEDIITAVSGNFNNLIENSLTNIKKSVDDILSYSKKTLSEEVEVKKELGYLMDSGDYFLYKIDEGDFSQLTDAIGISFSTSPTDTNVWLFGETPILAYDKNHNHIGTITFSPDYDNEIVSVEEKLYTGNTLTDTITTTMNIGMVDNLGLGCTAYIATFNHLNSTDRKIYVNAATLFYNLNNEYDIVKIGNAVGYPAVYYPKKISIVKQIGLNDIATKIGNIIDYLPLFYKPEIITISVSANGTISRPKSTFIHNCYMKLEDIANHSFNINQSKDVHFTRMGLYTFNVSGLTSTASITFVDDVDSNDLVHIVENGVTVTYANIGKLLALYDEISFVTISNTYQVTKNISQQYDGILYKILKELKKLNGGN